MKVYQKIAALSQAITNCEKSGNIEWLNKHTDALEAIINNQLPSGSGFDDQCYLEICTPERMVFSFGYHCMNDHGYYDGWIMFKLTIKPAFDGFTQRLTGWYGSKYKPILEDYINDAWYESLNAWHIS